MLTRLRVRNFRRFGDLDIELGSPVVLVGPNNSGKTSALQALALWDAGIHRWQEKRGGRESVPEKRPGVTINRRDLVSIPVPDAKLLWRNQHVRDVRRLAGEMKTANVRVEITVDGVDGGVQWTCGLEFDYANEESLYCRPLRGTEDGSIPPQAYGVRVAFLPPLSGLATNEARLDPGQMQVRIGEGRTAEVLRNLCYRVAEEDPNGWERLVQHLRELFGVTLERPRYVPGRGEIEMAYREAGGATSGSLDISASGRGLQQTLLLLAYLAANPGSVLLLDEPDAHLEILRQRQIYRVVCAVADETGSQVVVATHSEVILNEAAGSSLVVAFVGLPHRVDDRGSQLLKSLREIGFEQYYQAEVTGWVLYLEGSTDLAILKTLADRLGHPAQTCLARPFVHYVANQPAKARQHFYGLRDAYPALVGIALFDQGVGATEQQGPLQELVWERREIENYIVTPEVLLAFARTRAADAWGPLFSSGAEAVMRDCIADLVPPVALRDPQDPWWQRTKMSDDFLDRLFERFFARVRLPNLMHKGGYHLLADLMPPDQIDPDVAAKLQAITAVAAAARPAPDGQA